MSKAKKGLTCHFLLQYVVKFLLLFHKDLSANGDTRDETQVSC